jgi:hypothetical protein
LRAAGLHAEGREVGPAIRVTVGRCNVIEQQGAVQRRQIDAPDQRAGDAVANFRERCARIQQAVPHRRAVHRIEAHDGSLEVAATVSAAARNTEARCVDADHSWIQVRERPGGPQDLAGRIVLAHESAPGRRVARTVCPAGNADPGRIGRHGVDTGREVRLVRAEPPASAAASRRAVKARTPAPRNHAYRAGCRTCRKKEAGVGALSARHELFFLERYMRAYESEWRAFVQAVEQRAAMPVTLQDGVNALLVAEAATLPARSRGAVKVDNGRIVE